MNTTRNYRSSVVLNIDSIIVLLNLESTDFTIRRCRFCTFSLEQRVVDGLLHAELDSTPDAWQKSVERSHDGGFQASIRPADRKRVVGRVGGRQFSTGIRHTKVLVGRFDVGRNLLAAIGKGKSIIVCDGLDGSRNRIAALRIGHTVVVVDGIDRGRNTAVVETAGIRKVQLARLGRKSRGDLVFSKDLAQRKLLSLGFHGHRGVLVGISNGSIGDLVGNVEAWFQCKFSGHAKGSLEAGAAQDLAESEGIVLAHVCIVVIQYFAQQSSTS